MDIGEQLLRFILKCAERRHIPDLHSFVISIDGGKAWVDCEWEGVRIDAITYNDGKEERTWFLGNVFEAKDYLLSRNADVSTIEQ